MRLLARTLGFALGIFALVACSSGTTGGGGLFDGGAPGDGGAAEGGNVAADAGDGGGQQGGPSTVTVEQVRAASIRLSACKGWVVGWNYDFWVSQFANGQTLGWPELIKCALAASDCATVLACEGYDAKAPCDDATYVDRCDDAGRRVRCSKLSNGLQLVSTFPCETPNRCAPDPQGGVTCSSGTCGADGDTCEGDIRVSCYSGLERRDDCVAEGERCAVIGPNIATCGSPASPDCKCAWFGPGYTCTPPNDAGTSGVDCWASQPDCLGSEGQTDCQGATARRCIGGKWWSFDCSSFSGGTCALTSDAKARCKLAAWP